MALTTGKIDESIVAEDALGNQAFAVTLVDEDGVYQAAGASLDEFGFRVTSGQLAGYSVVHKFGHSDTVGSPYSPIAQGAVYNTPQVAGATALRIKAGNTNDTAGGSGARQITVQGLDETGAEVTETITTAGTSASDLTTTTWLRVYRMHVSESGTYASATAGSHAAAITLETSGGTEWATIPVTNFPFGQSEIGVYTVPLGKTAYISQLAIEVDSTKTPDVLLFQRRDVLQTSAPYSGMRVVQSYVAIEGTYHEEYDTPLGPFPALTDIGFMGYVGTGSAAISVDFTIIVVDDE